MNRQTIYIEKAVDKLALCNCKSCIQNAKDTLLSLTYTKEQA